MKCRFIIPIALAIAVGFLFSNLFYNNLSNDTAIAKNKSFFIELKDNIEEESLKNLRAYIKIKEKDKVYICVGITSNKNNSEKIKSFYESKGFNVEIKESNINNEAFYNNLIQYDILLADVKKEEDLISVSKVILSSYEEQL